MAFLETKHEKKSFTITVVLHVLLLVILFFFGFRISKQARTSNWSAKKLTTKQINYAATDAWVGRELYSKFIDEKLI